AVNGSQLFATNQAINQVAVTAGTGWNLTAGGANSTNVAPGETIDLNNSDGNLVVSKSATDDAVTFDLADDIAVSSVTLGGTVLNSAGLVIAGGPSITTAGINAGGMVITNVAAGQVSAASTDAVNGAQLFATNQAIDDIAVTAGTGWNLTAGGANSTNVAPGETIDLNNSDGNLVVSKNATDDAVTFDLADDIAVNSVTLGGTVLNSAGLVIAGGPSITTAGINAGGMVVANVAAGVNPTDAVNMQQLAELQQGLTGDYVEQGAQGGTNSVAVGTGSQTVANNAVALGNGAVADRANTVSVGAAGAERQVTNVAAGTADTDAVNLAQMRDADITVLNEANAYTDQQISNISNSISDTLAGDYVEQGAQGGTNSVAVGTGSQTAADNAVALGNGAVADRANTVSVGAAGAERQVTNVAAGTADTDAVNLAQMRAGDAQTLTEANTYTDSRTSYAVSTANNYTDARISEMTTLWDDQWQDVSNRVDRLDRDMQRLGAMSAALTMMVGSSADSPSRVSAQVGVGFYGSSAALAVGLKARLSKRSAMAMGLSHDGAKALGGIGLSFNLD
ncbi:YadA-like family protein, partial [Rhizobium sp. TRM95111]|uniref:YadA family autotransporter adhesin n=1 Tax=Rhizobium alarense TaxID=2846851 RepID=UPI001F3963D2